MSTTSETFASFDRDWDRWVDAVARQWVRLTDDYRAYEDVTRG